VHEAEVEGGVGVAAPRRPHKGAVRARQVTRHALTHQHAVAQLAVSLHVAAAQAGD
jgi:hypothetical protein